MASLSIDLCKYEVQESVHDGQEIYHGIDTMDFQHIDAEIIDDGISEDEFEGSPPLNETPVSYSILSKKKEDSGNSSTRTNRCDNEDPYVKVIHKRNKKYPWHCSNNKKPEKKYVDTVKHARKIIMEYKNKMPSPVTVGVINLDDSSDSYDPSDKSTLRDSVRKIITPTDKVPIFKKKYTRKKKMNYTEMIRKQQIINKRQIRSVMIDIKKNQGLIGMKVQKLPESETIKGIFTKKKKRRGKHKHNIGLQEDLNSNSYINAYDKIQTEHDKTQTEHDSSLSKSEQNKSTFINNKKPVIDRTKLKCSLQITSPKILMKIRKVTNKEDNQSDKLWGPDVELTTKSKENDIADCQIGNLHSQILSSGDHSNRLSDCNKTIKYKPMPKSKKIALENYINLEDAMPKIIESQQTKTLEQLKSTTPNTNCSTESHIKETTCDENTRSSKFKHENRYLINREHASNKFTEKVLKLAKFNPSIINKMSSARKKKLKVNSSMKTNRELIQSNSPKKVEPPTTTLTITENDEVTKIIHNTNHANKYEVPVIYKTPSMAHPPESAAVNVPNVDKNMYNFSAPTLLRPNQNNIEHNMLLVLPNTGKKASKHPKDFLKKSCKEQDETGTPSIEPKSFTVESSMQNLKSHITDQLSKEEATSTVRAHEKKQSEPKYCRDDNPLIISPLQSVSDPEYIISDVNINQIQQQKCNSVLSSDDQLIKNVNIKTTPQLNEPNILDLQAPKVEPQEDSNLLLYPDEYILGDVTINDSTSNMAANKSNIFFNSCILPYMARIQPNHNKRPYLGTTLQRPPSDSPANPENALSRKPMLNKFTPQTLLRQVHHWTSDQHNKQNLPYPPGMTNIHRMPWNDRSQHIGINRDPNNYSQPPVYNTIHYQNMQHIPPGTCDVQPNNSYQIIPRMLPQTFGVQSNKDYQNTLRVPQQTCGIQPNKDYQNLPCMPPQICGGQPNNDYQNMLHMPSSTCSVQLNNDSHNMPSMFSGKSYVQPNKIHSQYNIRLPPFPPPQLQPLAPSYQVYNNNNFKNRSVIGKNMTGLVKKINISNLPHSKLNGKVVRKQSIKEKKLQTKKELNKIIMPTEIAIKPEVNRPNTTVSCRKQNLSVGRPGPLSKKVKVNTPNLQTQQIGYSPPILPIQSFQNILSEFQIGVNVAVKYDPSVNNQNKSDALARNSFVNVNDISQNKSNIIEHLQTEDNTKKITLEEYKKRNKISGPIKELKIKDVQDSTISTNNVNK